ncbi:MAG: Peptide chain release factor 2, partial [Parcubacteria group bacterium GW2011_GWC2_38_7]
MQDLINRIVALRDRLQTAWQLLKIDEKRTEIIKLQNIMSAPGFWDNQESATTTALRASDLETEVNLWEKIKKELNDLLEITELDKEDQSVSLRTDVEKQIERLEKVFAEEEFSLLFSHEYDAEDAIVAIHAGAGGTDAQDWAEMLLRMYMRFCEKQGWKTAIINTSYGGEAGIKSVLFEVTGKQAYGYLKSEAGVHRL